MTCIPTQFKSEVNSLEHTQAKIKTTNHAIFIKPYHESIKKHFIFIFLMPFYFCLKFYAMFKLYRCNEKNILF